jgi:hypothetical protein
VLVSAAVVALFGVSARAQDDAKPDGAWSLSPITETFTVHDWGPSCGKQPASDILFPGAQVTLRTDGSELAMTGGAVPLRTDKCLDPLPTLSKASHSGDGHQWRTSCATAANDPRHATINTAYFLTGNSIRIAETGRYEFSVAGTRCVADVSRSGILTKVVQAAPAVTSAPAPAPAPAPTAEPKVDCKSPGDPVRLEVRPSRKLLKLGDVFSFSGVVLDANNCATSTPIQWAVGPVTFGDGQTHSAQPTIDASGKLTVPAADFADGKFEVVATAAEKSARARVEVASAANYDALLAQSGLDSTGALQEPAVAAIDVSTAIGATGARAEDNAAKRRVLFIAIIAGLAVILAALALVGRIRSLRVKRAEEFAELRHAERMQDYEKAKKEQDERNAVNMKKYQENIAIAQQQAAAAAARGIDTGPVFCLSCRREFPGGISFCPFDANRLVTVRGHGELTNGPPGAVCPTCRRGYNPGVKVCPKDGDDLVPAATLGPPSQAQPPAQGKICPQCGDRPDGGKAFCGKDGTQLVLLN